MHASTQPMQVPLAGLHEGPLCQPFIHKAPARCAEMRRPSSRRSIAAQAAAPLPPHACRAPLAGSHEGPPGKTRTQPLPQQQGAALHATCSDSKVLQLGLRVLPLRRPLESLRGLSEWLERSLSGWAERGFSAFAVRGLSWELARFQSWESLRMRRCWLKALEACLGEEELPLGGPTARGVSQGVSRASENGAYAWSVTAAAASACETGALDKTGGEGTMGGWSGQLQMLHIYAGPVASTACWSLAPKHVLIPIHGHQPCQVGPAERPLTPGILRPWGKAA